MTKLRKLETLKCDLALSHWGAYEVDRAPGGVRLHPWRGDPDPSPIGLGMLEAYASDARIQRPAVRQGWLEGHKRTGRGREKFIEVSWDVALDLVAGELAEVIAQHGNEAIFGGSYGWASAGRFHHAQSQIHRFLNVLGGYVRSRDTYSLAAGNVIMPHIVADMDTLMTGHHAWDVLADNTKLLVSFGGLPYKNSQITPGGAMEHGARPGMKRLAGNGCRIVNVSPVRLDLEVEDHEVEWIPIRPNSDTAMLLGMVHELIVSNRADEAFLATHCVGFERWREYVLGSADKEPKSPKWAELRTGVPAEVLSRLAHDLADVRSFVNMNWSLQRAEHGEQPFWAVVGLAAVLGQIGLPGGGFGVGYGPSNIVGGRHKRISGPALPQGTNAVKSFIPVSRIADLLLSPGEQFSYNGETYRYPNIEIVYWAGGNPFHHHQDLHCLARAWQKPRAVIVHEQVWNATAKMADIVLPVTSSVERNDIGSGSLEPLVVAMHKIAEPPGEARDDYDIFSALSDRLGVVEAFTEGRTAEEWLSHIYNQWSQKMVEIGYSVPEFNDFWSSGAVSMPVAERPLVMLEAFREDPVAYPLSTPSGRIELFSQRVDSFGYNDCPGHAVWIEPTEWLGAPLAERFPLHLLSDQPGAKLHSQLDFSAYSRSKKVGGREPILMSVVDAAARGIQSGDVVRAFNDRGSCLGGAVVSDGVLPGVVRMATGAWWNPGTPGDITSIDAHGNPNCLTRDIGASALSQGCAAQTCLVQVERFAGEPPAVTAYSAPAFCTQTFQADLNRGEPCS